MPLVLKGYSIVSSVSTVARLYTLNLQAGEDYVGRQDQLNLRSSGGRGRGKGRGRGRGGLVDKSNCHDPKPTEETEKEVTKKRKIATPQAQKYEEFWTEEMCEEWKKWKGDQWNEGWNHDDWREDLGQPGKAFDRYAVLDGQVSLHKLKDGDTDQASRKGNGKRHDKDRSPGKTTKKSKTSEPEKKDDVECDADVEELPPVDEKQQVKELAKYLREFQTNTGDIKDFEGLTEEFKETLKKAFAPTDECRFQYYWKRPAFGVYLKGEKKDFGCFFVNAEHGSFGLRLCAAIKAAGMLATQQQKKHFCTA